MKSKRQEIIISILTQESSRQGYILSSLRQATIFLQGNWLCCGEQHSKSGVLKRTRKCRSESRLSEKEGKMKWLYPLCVLLVAVSAEGLWIDTHYSDFMEGIYDAEIYVSRRLQQEISPSDSGCIEYHAKFDVNNDGWYDLVSSDKSGPSVKIWLGSSSGYSQSNSLTYPITSGGNCDISDLNLDGYPELIHSGLIM
ncbi:VCBS repeat-containing protein, partial [candidate division TA06 bacterium]